MVIANISLLVLFLIYNYLIFGMIDTFLDNSRLKKIYRLPIGVLNAFLGLFLTILMDSTAFMAYISISVILLVEFIIFYKDKISSSMFCMLACVIHIMCVRSLCVALFALFYNQTLYDIVNNPFTLVLSTCVTLAFLNIMIFCVTKFIPAKKVRIINQHYEQLWYMVSWITIFCVYLINNARVFSLRDTHPLLIENQIVAPIVILLGTYIVLFYSFKTSMLLDHKEINDELQLTIEKERQYRASIDKDVFRIIEVNFSKNEIISGFEDYEQKLGDTVHNYTEMLAFMIQATVHPDDAYKFSKYSSPKTAIAEFKQGNTQISFDYRRLMPDGTYVWMRVLLPLMQNEITMDILGYVQIRDIDEEKKQQLELQYKAERDELTGLFNKSTTEKMIREYLNSGSSTAMPAVLYIIDIDDFKIINDSLGHLYGDAVLSELSECLKDIFINDEIVGRIGGDEFLVFAKGTMHKECIIEKAKEICDAFLRTFANEKNVGYTVSSSIGIATYPQDGSDYETLFNCADAALYTTKARGKNSFSFYEQGLELSYVSTRTAIDTHGIVQKSFKDNRVEYVFRLLYGSKDTKFAIESALELIAKNFGFSRANIFEFNELSTHFNGVFEWCANGIDSVSDNYINMPVSSFDFIVSALEKAGGMFFATPDDFPVYAQESYTSIGIKSIVHFSIKEVDKLIGVIAFQNCIHPHFSLSDTEFEELRTICQVLSIFMAKQLSKERELRHHHAVETIVDNMNSIAYVIDRENYDVYYENQNVYNITGYSAINKKCYQVYRGYTSPCDDCPLNHLSEENPRCTLELYTEKFDIYTKTSASLIDWSNDRKAMLISSVDITEYKK